jgi:BirA family biotin operon repressor/biotin-[acetyl-CoA-carboxylase] ligase
MSWLAKHICYLETCDSTNDVAARLGAEGAAHGTVVVADHQGCGRGRRGRSWYSPRGENLYFSCLLLPVTAPATLPPITLAAGVAVCEASRTFGVPVELKWPNDLYTKRGKLGGILTEMTVGVRGTQVVLGIGVNLNTTQFPDPLSGQATSFARELGVPVERDEFLVALCEALAEWLDRFFAGGVAAVAQAWNTRARLGPVRFEVPGRGPIEGRATGLAPDGALEVADARGDTHRIHAGEIEVLG